MGGFVEMNTYTGNGIDAGEKNFFAVLFQNNGPYQPVYLAAEVMPLVRQIVSEDREKDITRSSDTFLMDNGVESKGLTIKEKFFDSLQNLVRKRRRTHRTRRLTDREIEVLNMVARGEANKQIAVRLGISTQTVKNHITAILNKLEANNRAHAAILGMSRGWISPDAGDNKS